MEKRTLGLMISLLRKEKEMTQMQLAQKMNVTDKAVSKWERDLACPDINSLSKLAEILGTTVEELVQAKKHEINESSIDKIKKIIPLILRAVALSMGVAVVVLTILESIDVKSAITMLGMGLACVSISILDEK